MKHPKLKNYKATSLYNKQYPRAISVELLSTEGMVLKKTVYSRVCGLPLLSGTFFMNRDVTVEFFILFNAFSRTNKIHLYCNGWWFQRLISQNLCTHCQNMYGSIPLWISEKINWHKYFQQESFFFWYRQRINKFLTVVNKLIPLCSVFFCLLCNYSVKHADQRTYSSHIYH